MAVEPAALVAGGVPQIVAGALALMIRRWPYVGAPSVVVTKPICAPQPTWAVDGQDDTDNARLLEGANTIVIGMTSPDPVDPLEVVPPLVVPEVVPPEVEPTIVPTTGVLV